MLTFLSPNELKTNKLKEVIDLIVGCDKSIIKDTIQENISVMRDGLRNHYDVAAIFNATGEERSLTVLKHLKSLVVYDLFGIRSHEPPPYVERHYNEAMRWLERVETGKSNPDLPVPQDEEGNQDMFLSTGTRPKYPSGW